MATIAAAPISKNNGIDFSFLALGRISRTLLSAYLNKQSNNKMKKRDGYQEYLALTDRDDLVDLGRHGLHGTRLLEKVVPDDDQPESSTSWFLHVVS